MLTLWTVRLMFLAVGLVVVAAMAAPAGAQDKDDPFKLPPLDDKNWKKQDNGLRTWDVKVGTGEEIKPGDKIELHYTGWLTNGKIFDSSKQRGESITFPLGSLIKGWQVGVPGMKVGGIRRLEIPYELGYGERGSPPVIPPKATLIFEIEVLARK